MNKYLSLFVQKNFLVRILVYILFISILLVFLTSFFYYINIETAFKNEFESSNMLYLKQCVNSVEIIMGQIKDSCSLNITMFREFENYPNAMYYEKIKGEISSEVAVGLRKYIDYKYGLIKNLYNLKRENDYVSSVYFYDSRKGIIITDRGLQYYLKDFRDANWYELYIKKGTVAKFLDTRKGFIRESIPSNVITVIFRTMNNMNYKNDNLLVVNLDEKNLYEKIFMKISGEFGRDFFVVSSDNKIIMHKDKSLLLKDLGELGYVKKLENRDYSLETTWKGSHLAVFSVESSLLDWKFVTVNYTEDIYKRYKYSKYIFSITIILALFFAVLLSIISSNGIYRPVKKLLNGIPVFKGTDGLTRVGEIDFIGIVLKDTLNNNEYLKKRLLESMPFYTEKLVYLLLKNGGSCYSMDELQKRLDFANINLNPKGMAVILLTASCSNRDREGIHNFGIDIIMQDILGARLKKHNFCMTALEENKIAVIINIEKGEIGSIFAIAQEIQSDVDNKLEMVLTIGISEYCESLGKLPEAFKQAEEALQYQSIAGTGEIIYISDVRIGKKSVIGYPTEKEALLNTYIKNGDNENAWKIFNDILDNVLSRDKTVTFQEIQQIFLRLLVSIINTVDSLGLDIRCVFPQGCSILGSFARIEDYDGYVRWFEKTIRNIAEYIDRSFDNKNRSHIDEIVKYINDNYSSNISLTLVSDKFNLNPGYVSRMFKKYMNRNFVDYLVDLRIEKGKSLLLGTSFEVQKVGKEVGYNNSYYFIKIFRERTGVTPGEFRRLFPGSSR